MPLSPDQHKKLMGGVWLVGLGVLFATGRWWPGIMFLVGVSALIEGWLAEHVWYGVQAGFWSILIGVWALCNYSVAVLFVGLGVGTILGAVVRPNPLTKPKPFVDGTLE